MASADPYPAGKLTINGSMRAPVERCSTTPC